MLKLVFLAILLVAEISAQAQPPWGGDNCSNSCLFTFGSESVEMFFPDTVGACFNVTSLFGEGLTLLSLTVDQCTGENVTFAFYPNGDCSAPACFDTAQDWTELFGDIASCPSATHFISVDCHLYTPTPTPMTPTPIETPTPIVDTPVPVDTPTPVVDTPTPIVDTPTPGVVDTPTPGVVETPTPTPTLTPTPTPSPNQDTCIAACDSIFAFASDSWGRETYFTTQCDEHASQRTCYLDCANSEAAVTDLETSCKGTQFIGELCDCGSGRPTITGERLNEILAAYSDVFRAYLELSVGGVSDVGEPSFSGNSASVVFKYEDLVAQIEGILEDIGLFLAGFLNQETSTFQFGSKKRALQEYTLSIQVTPPSTPGSGSVALTFSFTIFLIVVLFQFLF